MKGDIPNLIQELDGLEASFLGNFLVRFARGKGIPNMMSNCATKDDNVKQGVGTKTVSTMYRNRGSFTGSVKTGNDLVVAALVGGDDFTSIPGRNTTHWIKVNKEVSSIMNNLLL